MRAEVARGRLTRSGKPCNPASSLRECAARVPYQLCRAFIYMFSATLSHVDVLYLSDTVRGARPQAARPEGPGAPARARLVVKKSESGVALVIVASCP